MEHGGGASPSNLLDDAVGPLAGRFVAVEDSVETSASFVLHHLIKRSLSPAAAAVVFLSFAHPFSHYDRILRKLVRKSDRDKDKTSGGGLVALYGEIQKVIGGLPQERKNSVTIIIDDVSLMEVAAKGSTNLVLDFLHYCHTLTSELGCSLVALNHEDIYSSSERPTLILQMEYLAGIIIKAEPLATGLAKDVHGQLTVLNRGNDRQGSRYNMCNFHFRVKENNVEYFYPGSRT